MSLIREEIKKNYSLCKEVLELKSIPIILIFLIFGKLVIFYGSTYILVIIIKTIILGIKILLWKKIIISNNFEKNIVNSIYLTKKTGKWELSIYFICRIVVVYALKYYRLVFFLAKVVCIIKKEKNLGREIFEGDEIIYEIIQETPWCENYGLEGEFKILGKKVYEKKCF